MNGTAVEKNGGIEIRICQLKQYENEKRPGTTTFRGYLWKLI